MQALAEEGRGNGRKRRRKEGRIVIVIVIVNSRFLQRPQKRSRGNQLIHRRLIKTESIGRGSKSRESGRQTVQTAKVDDA